MKKTQKRQKEVQRIAREMSSGVNRTKKVYYSPELEAYSLVIYQDPMITIHRVGEYNLKAYTPLWVYYYTQRIKKISSRKEYDLFFNENFFIG